MQKHSKHLGCVTNLFGDKIEFIPVENVVRDIKESRAKNIIFLDDNIIAHPKYAKALFKAIKPLKINWVGQASVTLLVGDEELMKLASESGCKILFMGIETVSEVQRESMRKSIKEIIHLEKALKKIKKMGILIHASIVYGFDNDTKDIFNETVRFLIRNKVSTVSFNILTPYPGTPMYEDLKKKNRIVDFNWTKYDMIHGVCDMKYLTAKELQEELYLAYRHVFDSWKRRFSGIFTRNKYKRRIYWYYMRAGVIGQLKKLIP